MPEQCARPIGKRAGAYCECGHAVMMHDADGHCALCAMLAATAAVASAMAAAPRRRRMRSPEVRSEDPGGTLDMFPELSDTPEDEEAE